MDNISEARHVAINRIQVPDKYRRTGSRVEDDKLRQSIERTGVQQPLVVSNLGDDKYVLIDGYRRLEIARFLKMKDVPCVVDTVPKGTLPEDYRDRIRFILDEHRQDLVPSQRAVLIKTLKRNFNMNNRQVGEYLGVDATTIHNWLMVDSYIPDVLRAVDAGEITQHAARVFEGMTEAGQRTIWKRHKKDLKTVSPSKLHRQLRERYHPKEHTQFYSRPEKVIRELDRVQTKRSSRRRKPIITKDDRETLFSDIELREAELRDAQRDLDKFKLEITLAARIIRTILQNDRLLALIPHNAREEFERFGEIY